MIVNEPYLFNAQPGMNCVHLPGQPYLVDVYLVDVYLVDALILISTPAGKLNLLSASIVLAVA